MNAIDESGGRQRNARGQGTVLRAELIEAAARLLATAQQPEALTLRQVAREVGVAPASIYGHFADLGVLLDEVLQRRYAEVAALMAAADGAATPVARLVARCAVYIRWGISHPGEYRTVFGNRAPVGITASSHAVGLAILADLTAALAAALDGRGAVQSREPAGRGILLWTSMHGLVDSYLAHPNVPWPSVDELIVELVATHSGHEAKEIAAVLPSAAGVELDSGGVSRTAAQAR